MTAHATTDYTSPTDDPTAVPANDVFLGLTFSFPVEQTALGAGKILTWTKGFSAKNAIGNDVVQLLQDAFNRKHMHVKCVALVNDVSLFFLVGNPNLDRLKRLSGLSSPERTQQEAASREPSLEQGPMEHTLRKLVCDLYSMFAKCC